MLCERCKKNNATVFYRESINGKERSLSLCEKCADKARKNGELETDLLNDGFFSEPLGGVDKLFGSLFGFPQLVGHKSAPEKKCSLCGATFRDLMAEGKAGCPECYRTFSDELSSTISRIHGTTSHTGGAPSRFKADRDLKDKIKSLEKGIKAAVDEENYEEAARLRDELRAIRAEKGDETK